MKSNHQYITHDVVKHLLKRLQKYGINKIATSFIGKTTGTFNPIRNPLEATIEKDMIMLIESKKHVVLRDMVSWLKENKEVFETYEFLGQGNKASKLIDKIEKKFFLPKEQVWDSKNANDGLNWSPFDCCKFNGQVSKTF